MIRHWLIVRLIRFCVTSDQVITISVCIHYIFPSYVYAVVTSKGKASVTSLFTLLHSLVTVVYEWSKQSGVYSDIYIYTVTAALINVLVAMSSCNKNINHISLKKIDDWFNQSMIIFVIIIHNEILINVLVAMSLLDKRLLIID